MRLLLSTRSWLERRGIDCSRTANESDAVAIGASFAFALYFFYPFLSGLLLGAGDVLFFQVVRPRQQSSAVPRG